MREVINSNFGVAAVGTSKGPAFAQAYALAGRFILIETTDAPIRDLFSHHFAAWHIERIEEQVSDDPRVTISIACGAAPPHPEHLEPFAVAQGGICYTDANSYFFSNNGSVVEATTAAPRVQVWLAENCLNDGVAMAQLIFNATMTALRRCALYELHAAGVVNPDGGGVLVIGPSGSSKSTLATQLAAAGWKYLSDDTLLLYENGGGIEARALRRVFAVTNETFDVFDNLQLPAPTIAPFDPTKLRFEPDAVFPQGFSLSCRPTSLFFSRLTNEKSSTRRLSPAETLTKLLRMCPWACYDKATARNHLQVLSDLARQARGFDLSVGRDLFGQPEKTSDYLMAHAR